MSVLTQTRPTATTPRVRRRWDPWRVLRSHADVIFTLGELPAAVGGGIYWPSPDVSIIIIDYRVGRLERLALLAHELIHHERGTYALPGVNPHQAISRDECRVDDEVARRLVPCDELGAMFDVAWANDLQVEPWQVAERFDVPDRVADRAMRLFLAGN